MLFDVRLGFSGTPSDLLPKELGSCNYEPGSQAKISTCTACLLALHTTWLSHTSVFSYCLVITQVCWFLCAEILEQTWAAALGG